MRDLLRLAPHVHMVRANDRLVFLDVERDRYFKLNRWRTADFVDVCGNAPSTISRELVAGGLLAPDAGGSDRPMPEARWGWAQLLGVLGACAWARRILATSRLRAVLAEVARAQVSFAWTDRSRSLTSSFLALRPLYPRDYGCLFDSLALLRFLSVRRARAEWVFGVRSAPFAAHCWVADRHGPLNDEPDVTSAYAEIMRI